jgi:hypothetical protein
MTKPSRKIPRQENESKLTRVVRFWLNNEGRNYDDGWKGAYRDLEHGGCQSGMVSHLIYYTDTVRFYRRHRTEIEAMLAQMLSDMGYSSPAELFGNKWDADDPLASAQLNQNLLAWFGFEETARELAMQNGYQG